MGKKESKKWRKNGNGIVHLNFAIDKRHIGNETSCQLIREQQMVKIIRIFDIRLNQINDLWG